VIYYIGINLTILYFSCICFAIKTRNKNSDKIRKLQTRAFLFCTFILLVFFSGFRGDFTSDYKNYASLFDLYNSFDFTEVLKNFFYEERGFVLFSRFIGLFTSNAIYLMLITSIIIVFFFLKEFKNDSEQLWLSVLLFVNIGAYYTSFNIMRHILAAAIVFAGSKYLYNRKFYKYLLIIIIATMFHATAILMLPFYFILNMKCNKLNFSIITLGTIFLTTFLDKIMSFVFMFVFKRYANYSYGMTGLNLTSVVVPISILIFIILHKKCFNINNTKNRIWINATIYYVVFSVLGLKIQMIQRFAEYFAPYVLLLIPLVCARIKDKSQRILYYFLIVILLIVYNYVILSGTGYDPYYFIWNKHLY
jgi:transmembrane protein EpsG